jgi:hypothetical protein
MKKLVAILIFSMSSSWSGATVTDDAYKICAAFDATGLAAGCEVKGGRHTIDAVIDTTGAEARKICAGMVDMVAKQTSSFRGSDWKLRIFSPYSGERPIAVCVLK